jgi:hypothetical protein
MLSIYLILPAALGLGVYSAIKRNEYPKKLRGLSPRANYTNRTTNRHLSAKLVPTTFADMECFVVSTTDPHGSILGFYCQKYENNVSGE